MSTKYPSAATSTAMLDRPRRVSRRRQAMASVPASVALELRALPLSSCGRNTAASPTMATISLPRQGAMISLSVSRVVLARFSGYLSQTSQRPAVHRWRRGWRWPGRRRWRSWLMNLRPTSQRLVRNSGSATVPVPSSSTMPQQPADRLARPGRSRPRRRSTRWDELSARCVDAGADAVGGAPLLAQGPGALAGHRFAERRRPGSLSGAERGQPAADAHRRPGWPCRRLTRWILRAAGPAGPAGCSSSGPAATRASSARYCSRQRLDVVELDVAVDHRHAVVRAGSGWSTKAWASSRRMILQRGRIDERRPRRRDGPGKARCRTAWPAMNSGRFAVPLERPGLLARACAAGAGTPPRSTSQAADPIAQGRQPVGQVARQHGRRPGRSWSRPSRRPGCPPTALKPRCSLAARARQPPARLGRAHRLGAGVCRRAARAGSGPSARRASFDDEDLQAVGQLEAAGPRRGPVAPASAAAAPKSARRRSESGRGRCRGRPCSSPPAARPQLATAPPPADDLRHLVALRLEVDRHRPLPGQPLVGELA